MHSKIIWEPSPQMMNNSRLEAFIRWVNKEKNLEIDHYHQLWEWSVKHYEDFWESVLQFFNPPYQGSYESVTNGKPMPDVRWFEGVELNYAECIFANRQDDHPAILAKTEMRPLESWSWERLEKDVASFQAYLKAVGVKKGDRVSAFISNIPEATVAFLATVGLGAIWSSCSPDFGADSVVDRFVQIEPSVLIAVDGYYYNGKPYDKRDVVEKICAAIPAIKNVVIVNQIGDDVLNRPCIQWTRLTEQYSGELTFERVPFNHPIWVLFSSGTTGNPKAITHSHGGSLLEHYKYLAFHNDVQPGENFYWYSTTGWMMWNFVHASLLAGATIVLYDGSAAYPDLHAMWEFIDEAKINHFGTSAPFLVACMNRNINPKETAHLSTLRSIGSTGSPLPPEAFDWVYKHVGSDIWLCSMSGGTDVCTAFVGGNILWPVRLGEIQCRALGCGLYAYDEMGNHVHDEVGEMVIETPMPSMPIYFWNDTANQRYLSSYFDVYEGKWRHGDWIRITPDNGLVIYGRSDATLNRQGVRIGTSEIYRALNQIESIKDALVVNLELSGGRHFMPLFVLMEDGEELTDELKKEIRRTLRQTYTPRHVPDKIIGVPDIPYTISGKKMEAPVKKILLGMSLDKSINLGAMRNPECVPFYQDIAGKVDGMAGS